MTEDQKTRLAVAEMKVIAIENYIGHLRMIAAEPCPAEDDATNATLVANGLENLLAQVDREAALYAIAARIDSSKGIVTS